MIGVHKGTITGYKSNSSHFLFQKIKENLFKPASSLFQKRLVIIPDKYCKAALQVAMSDQKVRFGTSYLLPDELMTLSYQDALSHALGKVHEKKAEKQAEKIFLYALYNLFEKGEPPQLLPCSDHLDRFDEIHLFHFSALCPKLHLRLMQCAKHIPVFYYVLSPCMLFWSDIASDKEASWMERTSRGALQKSLQPLLYNRSKLLANNGHLARDFTRLLDETVEYIEESYLASSWMIEDLQYSQNMLGDVTIDEGTFLPTLLEVAKAELLFLGGAREEKIAIGSTDKSIEFCKAPTLMREVEALYRHVQEFSKRAQPFSPGSIVVLMPDIKKYQPYLEGLFSHSCQYLGRETGEIIQGFEQMVTLYENKFQLNDLFELFKNQNLRTKTGITTEDLTTFSACLHRLGQTFDSEGIHRLCKKVSLAWISMDIEGLELTTNEAVSIGKVLSVVRQLICDLTTLFCTDIRSITEWIKAIRELLENYFAQDSEFDILQEALGHLFKSASMNKLENVGLFGIKALLYHAVEKLQNTRPATIFSPIVFATLGKYTPTSCDMLCLLGMNDDALPRKDITQFCEQGFLHSENLPLRVQHIDRHLLLSCLLAVKSRLFISWQSYSFEDRQERVATGFVQDLLHTLDETCRIDNKLPSMCLLQAEKLDALAQSARVQLSPYLLFKNGSMDVPERIFIHELSQVAKYPLRPYFQKNLGLYLGSASKPLPSTEFEAADSFAFSKLKNELFFATAVDAGELFDKQYGSLPHVLKKAVKRSLDGEIAKLHQAAHNFKITTAEVMQIELDSLCRLPQKLDSNSWKFPSIPFEIDGKSFSLEGRLRSCHQEGYLFLGAKSREALFRAWPELLVASLLAKLYPDHFSFQSKAIFLKDQKSVMLSFSDPGAALNRYVAYAIDCRKMAFCLYPDWIDVIKESEQINPFLFKQKFMPQDPYLDYFLSRVAPDHIERLWSDWQKTAHALFSEVHDGI